MEEIATVYARSLFEVAQEQGKLDVVRDQLGAVADAIDASRELQTFFFSPYFSTAEKRDGLDRAVSDADEFVVNFLKLLIENHRMPAIFRTRREFDRLWQQENKLLPVTVTSAVALDQATVDQIGARIANSIRDASIRNRLEQLRKQVARA